VLWQRLLHQERAEIRRMTGSQALFVKNKTEAELKARILPLEHLARRWEVRGEPPELEGESDAALVMSGYRGYQAIEWVDEDLRVRWVAPRARNRVDLGADLGVIPAVRAAFETAEDTRRIRATHPIELRQGGRGFLVCVPIYPAGKFGGFLVGIFRYEELLYAILEDVARDYWVSVHEGDEQIYSPWGASTPREDQWAQEVPMHVAQLDWRLRVWPKQETLARAMSPLPQVTLVGGLVMAALLAFAVHFAQTAHMRAQEVAAANVELKNEIAEREQAEEALRVSEANYRSLVDNSPYGIARVTLDGRIVMANPVMVELLG
jgi:sensor domain CHASE-containing protein